MDLEILKIASNTENNKILNKYTHSSKLKNSMCGDEISVTINIKNSRHKNFEVILFERLSMGISALSLSPPHHHQQQRTHIITTTKTSQKTKHQILSENRF